jgi:hypothetical protein
MTGLVLLAAGDSDDGVFANRLLSAQCPLIKWVCLVLRIGAGSALFVRNTSLLFYGFAAESLSLLRAEPLFPVRGRRGSERLQQKR